MTEKIISLLSTSGIMKEMRLSMLTVKEGLKNRLNFK